MTLPVAPFASTGLAVTRLGLGLAALGRPGYIDVGHAEDLPADRSVASMEARAHRVLDVAVAKGIRYVDVARSYGRAEQFLASWLRDNPTLADAVTVGSKWGYTYTADWQVDADVHEVKDHSLATFIRQLSETRAQLGEHLDLYQIHSATLATGVLDDDEVLEALGALDAAGVVVGLSVSGPGQGDTIRRALEVTAAGRAPFRAVQATWNLLEPSAGAALTEAAEAGWGVIVKEAVANGRLTSKARVASVLSRVAGRAGVGVDAVALAAATAQPFRPLVLSGASTVAHLQANLAAADVTLDPDELASLETVAEPADAYWATRSNLAWT